MATCEQVSINLAMSESEFETEVEDEENIEPRLKSVVRGAYACPVIGCVKGRGIRGKGVLRQHWRNTHLKQVLTFGCPVRGCEARRRRRTDMNRHMHTHQEFSSEEEVR